MSINNQELVSVYFDESGWTGADYINEEQPLFVMGCHWFSMGSCQAIENSIRRKFKGGEPKFTKLIKTQSGKVLLKDTARLLVEKSVGAEGFTAFVVHKKSILVRKFVLDCIEPVLRGSGINMFKDGQSVAYANLISTTLPVFMGKEWYKDFLALFNRLIRSKKEKDNLALYKHCRSAVKNKDACDILSPYLSTPSRALDEIGAREYRSDCYESSILGLITHLNHTFGIKNLKLVLDQTKATSNPELASFLESLETVQTSLRVSDVCTIHPGIEVESVVMGDSRLVIGIRVADIIAGLFSWCFRNEGNLNSDIGKAMVRNLREEHMIHIIDSNQVTSESLGMKDSEIHIWMKDF